MKITNKRQIPIFGLLMLLALMERLVHVALHVQTVMYEYRKYRAYVSYKQCLLIFCLDIDRMIFMFDSRCFSTVVWEVSLWIVILIFTAASHEEICCYVFNKLKAASYCLDNENIVEQVSETFNFL